MFNVYDTYKINVGILIMHTYILYVLEAERLYVPPPLPEHSMMPESPYKGRAKKSNVSKAPNNNKSNQSNKTAVKVAATEEVSTNKTDLAHLVASLTDKISKMEIKLQ